MKKLLLIACFLLAFSQTNAQTEFVLDPSQSMLMTGKGAGQDATINPYSGQDCFAIIENIGTVQFSIRVENQGKIVEEIPIEKGEIKKVKLLKGYELYLDPNATSMARARVKYEQ